MPFRFLQAIHHDVALTTFAAHFDELGKLSKLRVNLLVRPI